MLFDLVMAVSRIPCLRLMGVAKPSSGPNVNVDSVCRKCLPWLPLPHPPEVSSPTEPAPTKITRICLLVQLLSLSLCNNPASLFSPLQWPHCSLQIWLMNMLSVSIRELRPPEPGFSVCLHLSFLHSITDSVNSVPRQCRTQHRDLWVSLFPSLLLPYSNPI